MDTGCVGVPGTWAVGTVRINTPFESFVYTNVSASLEGNAAYRLPVRCAAAAAIGGSDSPGLLLPGSLEWCLCQRRLICCQIRPTQPLFLCPAHPVSCSSLPSSFAPPLQTRWQVTMGAAMAQQSRPAPCLGSNYTSFQYTAGAALRAHSARSRVDTRVVVVAGVAATEHLQPWQAV